ncbi:nitrilase-related carbon-nitrogen hydrolase [Calditrichota bacterium]
MNVSLFQYDPFWEDKKSNQQKIVELIQLSKIKTDVLVFPEMTLTGFTMRSKKYSESIDGETLKFFQEIAQKYNIHVFGGFVENVKGKFFNCLVHVDGTGKLQTKYHKIHPFSFSGENRHYSPGKNLVTTTIDDIEIGMSICYDLRFPELFRHYAKKRVTTIINIANWPVQRIEHWQNLLKSRAIENLCYMIGVNRVGKDKGNNYNGRSAVYGPFGEEIILMDNSEKIVTFELENQRVIDTREKFPFLNDIRII